MHVLLRAGQRFNGGGLTDRARIRRALRLQLRHIAYEFLGPASVAYAPPGHRVGLGDAVHRQRARIQFWFYLRDGGELAVFEQQVLVNVVGQYPHLGMAQQHAGKCREFAAAVGSTGRVARRIEHQPLGARRDRRFELLGGQLEAFVFAALDRLWRAVGDQRHVAVRHPVRRGYHHFVALRKCRHHRVEHDLLGAVGDRDLVAGVDEAILALEFQAHRIFHFVGAVDGGVARIVARHRFDHCALDVVRRREIRLADGEAYDVAPLRAQLAHFLRGSVARGMFDAIQSRCKYHVHAAQQPLESGMPRPSLVIRS